MACTAALSLTPENSSSICEGGVSFLQLCVGACSGCPRGLLYLQGLCGSTQHSAWFAVLSTHADVHAMCCTVCVFVGVHTLCWAVHLSAQTPCREGGFDTQPVFAAALSFGVHAPHRCAHMSGALLAIACVDI